MPVPTEELKLEIVNAATGKTLVAETAPGRGETLVVRELPEDGPSPEQWQIVPVPSAQDEQVYVIRNAVSGKVLDQPAADGGVRQEDAADNKKSQQWRVVPVEGEAGLCFIESAAGDVALDLGGPDENTAPVVLRTYDEEAESQRWRLVPAEPERVADPALRWVSLDHWNGRRSWRLNRSAALRPVPGATPSFSDMLLVLDRFGSTPDAGAWKSEGAAPSPDGRPGWWAGLGARFLADTTGGGRAEVIGLKPAKGAVAAAARGDGTFEDEERVLHRPAPSSSHSDLWTLADVTGGGEPAVVVLAADGVRVSPRGEDGTFEPVSGESALKAFGHGEKAGGWLVDKHPRFLADTTGDGRLDVATTSEPTRDGPRPTSTPGSWPRPPATGRRTSSASAPTASSSRAASATAPSHPRSSS